MKKNLNDNDNQQPDSKLNQTEINRIEFNPNNPLANNSKHKIKPQSIQKSHDLSTTADITNTASKRTENIEKDNLSNSPKA